MREKRVFKNTITQLFSPPQKAATLPKIRANVTEYAVPPCDLNRGTAPVQGRITPPSMLKTGSFGMHAMNAPTSAPAATTKTQFQLGTFKTNTSMRVPPFSRTMHSPADTNLQVAQARALAIGLPPRVSSIYRAAAAQVTTEVPVSSATGPPGPQSMQAYALPGGVSRQPPGVLTQSAPNSDHHRLTLPSHPHSATTTTPTNSTSAIPRWARKQPDRDNLTASTVRVSARRCTTSSEGAPTTGTTRRGPVQRRASDSAGNRDLSTGVFSDEDSFPRATVTGKRSARYGIHSAHSRRRAARGRTSSSI